MHIYLRFIGFLISLIDNCPTSGSDIATEYNNQSSPSTFYTLGTETANVAGRLILTGN